MSETKENEGTPRWFMFGVLFLLVLLVGLTWMNGAMLNHQRHQLTALEDDFQALTEAIYDTNGQEETESGLVPSHGTVTRKGHLLRVQRSVEESDPALKDLRESRDSGQKAVRDARDIQRKLSVGENARLADEKAQREAAEHPWRPWVYGVMALACLALVVRALLRRRG